MIRIARATALGVIVLGYAEGEVREATGADTLLHPRGLGDFRVLVARSAATR